MTNILVSVILAMMAVESGNNPTAVGVRGESGPLQISQCVLDDVNRIYSLNYTMKDCLNQIVSVHIAKLYLSYWVGRDGTAEQYARVWNGGPEGMAKESTTVYWLKVKKEMERVEA